jgi:hypothetical protein
MTNGSFLGNLEADRRFFYRCVILGALPPRVCEVLVYACSENQYGGMHCAGLLGVLVLVSALSERVPADFAGRQIPAKIRKLLKIEVLECS